MDCTESLARAILNAQELREDSWTGVSHTLGHREAADKACWMEGFDTRMTEVVYLLNAAVWNEARYWAERVVQQSSD